MSTQPILVHKIINFSDPIAKTLLNKLRENQEILHQLKLLTPKTLSDNLISCTKKDYKLLIFTESSVWASQLRFYSPTLLQSLNNQSDLSLKQIQIKILPPISTRDNPSFKHRAPSDDTIKCLKNHATSLVDNDLKRSILRLANSLEKRFSSQ